MSACAVMFGTAICVCMPVVLWTQTSVQTPCRQGQACFFSRCPKPGTEPGAQEAFTSYLFHEWLAALLCEGEALTLCLHFVESLQVSWTLWQAGLHVPRLHYTCIPQGGGGQTRHKVNN